VPTITSKTGEILTDETIEKIRQHDAILLGAIGDPARVAPGVLERGLLLKLRFSLDHFVNLRPAKLYEGVTSPLAGNPEMDFVVVREGTEGLYCGDGGAIRVGTPQELATETSLNTRFGVERVVRDAFERAMKRRKKVTLVHRPTCLPTRAHCGNAPWMRSPKNTAMWMLTTATSTLPPYIW